MDKRIKRAIWSLLIAISYIYMLNDRQKYPLPENVMLIYKYHYIPAGWCLCVSVFNFVMALKKNKGKIMKKIDEKSGKILFILTLVLGNDYIFFLSIKMSQASDIQTPLNALELLISYIIIILTAITTLVWMYKIIKNNDKTDT